MSYCNPGTNTGFCCGGCCTAMNTVNPTPGICQSPCGGGCGGAGSTQSFLNTVGRYGTTLAGIFSGRPVTTTNKGVSVGPSAQYAAARTASFTPVILIVALVIVAFLFLGKR